MSAARELESSLARASASVDDRFGIVRQVVVHEIGPSDPPFFFATAQLASTVPFSDAVANSLNGGAGIMHEAALMGALGEALERYSIGTYREHETVRASFREVERVALDPSRLICFADEQYAWERFPYARFDPGAPLSWVVGRSLTKGDERLVPAARVYTPYLAPRPEERLLQSTSTGAACHVDRDRAIILALYECVERDAVMIAWLNRLPLPDLDLPHIDHRDLTAALERCRGSGFDVRLFDATSDVAFPTVLSVLSSPAGVIPALAVGAASRSTVGEAAEKALLESAHTLFWIHTRCRRSGLPRFRSDYSDVVSLDLHSLLYGDPAMRPKMAFLLDPAPGTRRARDRAPEHVGCMEHAPAELDRCRAVLSALDLDAVVVDVTPRDVADLGFVVVRVVVGGLHPLWGGHHVRCLGGPRVAQVPVTLGYRGRPSTPAELNSDPHPMP